MLFYVTRLRTVSASSFFLEYCGLIDKAHFLVPFTLHNCSVTKYYLLFIFSRTASLFAVTILPVLVSTI
jgi:hypothetical protein